LKGAWILNRDVNMATKAKTEEAKTPKIKKSKTQNVELTDKKVVKKTVKKETVKKEPVKKVVEKTPKIKKSKTQNVELTEKVEAVEVVKEIPKVVEVKEEKIEKISGMGVTVEQLFEAGVHYGHVVKKWNPKMKKYLWGAMNGIHIFDLEKTVAGLSEAVKTLTELAAQNKRIVLVGTKRQAKQLVEDEAVRIGVPFITQRWLGGLVTNWRQVKQTIDRLNKLKKDKADGSLKKYTKKEQVLFDKEAARLERIVGGISTLKDAPEVVVIFDTHKEKIAVKESNSRGVKVIGLVDSNANPDNIDVVIPMNDDSAKGLEIVVKDLSKSIESGMKQ